MVYSLDRKRNAEEGWRIDHAHGQIDAYSVTVK